MNAGCHVHVQHTAAFLHMLLEENHKIDQSLERIVGLAPWKVPIQPLWKVGFLLRWCFFQFQNDTNDTWNDEKHWSSSITKVVSITVYFCSMLNVTFWNLPFGSTLIPFNMSILTCYDLLLTEWWYGGCWFRLVICASHVVYLGDVGHISKHVSNLFCMRCWQYGRQVLLKDYVLFQPGTSCRSSSLNISSMERPTIWLHLTYMLHFGELQKPQQT